MQTREKLKGIQCPNDISQVGRLALIFALFSKQTNLFLLSVSGNIIQFSHIQIIGANAPSHLMVLMRIQTALEGGQAITKKMCRKVKTWEKDRQSKYKD